MFILCVSLFFYLICWYIENLKEGTEYINVSRILGSVLDLTGRKKKFAVSGIFYKLYARMGVLVSLVYYIYQHMKPTFLIDEGMLNGTWILWAFTCIGIGIGVEDVIKCKRSLEKKKKKQLIISSVLMFASALFFLIPAIVAIFMLFNGYKFDYNGGVYL